MLALWHLLLMSEPRRAVQAFIAHHSRNWYPKDLSALFFLELLLHSDIVSSGLYQNLLFSLLTFPQEGRPGRCTQFHCLSGPALLGCLTRLLVPKRYSSSPENFVGFFVPPSRGTGRSFFLVPKKTSVLETPFRWVFVKLRGSAL